MSYHELKERFEKLQDTEISDLTLSTASKLVDKLYILTRQKGLWWWPPLISGSGRDGGVYLEWRNKEKKYTLFVRDDEVDYYAYHLDIPIEEGDINIENDLTEFWEWIAE